VRAESGEEAISLVKQGTGADLILMDVQMPDM
jgi:CheY-like chemotaxis protein